MRYIIKYLFGGILYSVCMLAMFLWYFNSSHLSTFDKFISDLNEAFNGDSGYEY